MRSVLTLLPSRIIIPALLSFVPADTNIVSPYFSPSIILWLWPSITMSIPSTLAITSEDLLGSLPSSIPRWNTPTIYSTPASFNISTCSCAILYIASPSGKVRDATLFGLAFVSVSGVVNPNTPILPILVSNIIFSSNTG